MKTLVILYSFLFWFLGAKAGEMVLSIITNPKEKKEVSITSESSDFFGSLNHKETNKSLFIVFSDGGSKLSDKHVNQYCVYNDSLKFEAMKLSEKNITSFRNDKMELAKSAISDSKKIDVISENQITDLEMPENNKSMQ